MLRTGLLCLIAVAVVAGAPSQDHSIQKRQTTVSADTGRLLSDISLTTVGAVLLVLLPLDVFGTLALATVFSGRSRQDYRLPVVGDLFERAYNSIDVVESALDYMSVEEEACRFKAVCLAERAAANNPLASLAINTINSKLSGLSRYAAAVEAGLNGEDCHLL